MTRAKKVGDKERLDWLDVQSKFDLVRLDSGIGKTVLHLYDWRGTSCGNSTRQAIDAAIASEKRAIRQTRKRGK